MKFRCSHCRQKLEADEELFGETLDCPSCDGEITVPYNDCATQEDVKVFFQNIEAFVGYEAQEKDELPNWEEIKDIDNSFFVDHEVCFTGFESEEKKHLKELATSLGMIHRSGITQKLTMLVCGRNAGPVKMAKAKERGLTILTIKEFKTKLENNSML